MLCIMITLSLLSVFSVDGIEPESDPHSTRAVSTQSYHRGDVPLSYTVTSYHDYTTTRPPIHAVNNHVPQYLTPKPIFNEQINQPPLQSVYKEQLKLSLLNQFREIIPQTTEKIINKKYLEPRLVAKHGRLQNVIYNSFVPGRNVAVAPSYRHKSPILTDLYTNYQDPVQYQKIIVPKHVINEKQKPLKLAQTQVIKKDPESQHLQNIGFPAVIPLGNFPEDTYDGSHDVHEHKDVLFPQQPAPRAPRLHLNIARVYGIAHIPHQAPEPTVSKKKPPSYTQAIIAPKPITHDKTLLYPVHKFFNVTPYSKYLIQ